MQPNALERLCSARDELREGDERGRAQERKRFGVSSFLLLCLALLLKELMHPVAPNTTSAPELVVGTLVFGEHNVILFSAH